MMAMMTQREMDLNAMQQISVGQAAASMVHMLSMSPTCLAPHKPRNVATEGSESIQIQQCDNITSYTQSVAKQLSEGI